jgi:DNA-binding beta-propeller fold protein YncE
MRLNGGVIGKSNQPTNRAAPGIWSSEEQRVSQLYGAFPRYYEGWDLTYLVNTTPRLLSTTTLSSVILGVGLDFSPDGTRLLIADRTSTIVTLHNLSTPWNTATASLSSTLSSVSVDGVAAQSDGTAFFSCVNSNPSVTKYTMSTPWAVSTGVAGQFLSISAQVGSSTATIFSENGDFLYVMGGNSVLYQYSLTVPWFISSASFLRSLSLSSRDSAMTGVAFKPDGLSMYVLGDTSNAVYQYTLSTAWDISTATYLQQATTSNTAAPSDIIFKPDGTRMYISTTTSVQQYNLSVPWDVITRSFAAEGFLPNNPSASNNPENLIRAIAFKSDGTRLFTVGESLDSIQEVSMVTPWQMGTLTHVSAFGHPDTVPTGLFFKPDGTRMYATGNTLDRVYEYLLTTPWGITTATTGSISSALISSPTDIYFKPDGTKLYAVSTTSVREFDLTDAWNIHSATLVTTFLVNGQTSSAAGIAFSSDGVYMYILGGGFVYKYRLNSPWSINSAQFDHSYTNIGGSAGGIKLKSDDSEMYLTLSGTIREYTLPLPQALRSPGDEGGFLNVSAQELSPTGLTFSPDGVNLYVTGSGGDDVNQYVLSTPWNVTTASFVRTFGVSSQETIPESIRFKPDGTRMYILGQSGDDINEYSLSTAWDISTASFVQLFSIAGRESSPLGFEFSPDGVHMYVVGSSSDNVNQYVLSTPWNISTASFVRVFVPTVGSITPEGIAFRPDGLRMFILDSTGDLVYQYNLSTPWDVSTSTFDKTLPIGYLDTNMTDLAFKSDGTKLYLIGISNDIIYELSLG